MQSRDMIIAALNADPTATQDHKKRVRDAIDTKTNTGEKMKKKEIAEEIKENDVVVEYLTSACGYSKEDAASLAEDIDWEDDEHPLSALLGYAVASEIVDVSNAMEAVRFVSKPWGIREDWRDWLAEFKPEKQEEEEEGEDE